MIMDVEMGCLPDVSVIIVELHSDASVRLGLQGSNLHQSLTVGISPCDIIGSTACIQCTATGIDTYKRYKSRSKLNPSMEKKSRHFIMTLYKKHQRRSSCVSMPQTSKVRSSSTYPKTTSRT